MPIPKSQRDTQQTPLVGTRFIALQYRLSEPIPTIESPM